MKAWRHGTFCTTTSSLLNIYVRAFIHLGKVIYYSTNLPPWGLPKSGWDIELQTFLEIWEVEENFHPIALGFTCAVYSLCAGLSSLSTWAPTTSDFASAAAAQIAAKEGSAFLCGNSLAAILQTSVLPGVVWALRSDHISKSFRKMNQLIRCTGLGNKVCRFY